LRRGSIRAAVTGGGSAGKIGQIGLLLGLRPGEHQGDSDKVRGEDGQRERQIAPGKGLDGDDVGDGAVFAETANLLGQAGGQKADLPAGLDDLLRKLLVLLCVAEHLAHPFFGKAHDGALEHFLFLVKRKI
jgi:hypothetical protein